MNQNTCWFTPAGAAEPQTTCHIQDTSAAPHPRADVLGAGSPRTSPLPAVHHVGRLVPATGPAASRPLEDRRSFRRCVHVWRRGPTDGRARSMSHLSDPECILQYHNTYIYISYIYHAVEYLLYMGLAFWRVGASNRRNRKTPCPHSIWQCLI